MIILDKKCIYIKIPKTGSTTVAAAIWDEYGVEREKEHPVVVNLNFHDHDALRGHGWHVKMSRIEEFLGASFGDYKKFTVIREPKERILSVYRWAFQKKPNSPLLKTFETFLDAVKQDGPELSEKDRVHTRTQLSWLTDANGDLSADIDIFTLNKLEECGAFFASNLGFSPDFGHKNASRKKEIELQPETERLIEDIYAEDFALYDRISRA